ncbi:MAG TPA: PQQ-binding-like beta-propeller repeat protein, partial [Steroidobacteraceae bacterium]
MTHSRFAFFACALLLLGACSKEKDIEPPAKLVAIPATLRIDRVWGSSVAGGDPVLRLGLGISVDGERAYASGRQGDVAAFDLKSGKKVWDVRLKVKLSGGTGAGNGLVVVGSSKGEVIALEAASGAVRWKAHVGGEVLSAPVVAAQTVIVRAVDGKLHGLALQDGHEAWLQEQQVPRLSLRGTSSPVVAGEAVLCGFDNGKVISVNEADGTLAWEAIVAPPRGRTELERLVDVDSAVKVIGDDVYAVGFQGRA